MKKYIFFFFSVMKSNFKIFSKYYYFHQLLKFMQAGKIEIQLFFFLKEDFITKSTKHNTKNYNYLQNMYKPTTTKISNTVHHKQDIMKR